MKECGLRIRVDQRLRSAFVDACRAKDLTASQVIRHFMRQYVEDAAAEKQRDIFETLTSSSPGSDR
ncbi:plasmid-related protein [Lentisalinibacter salinarum]|uniref:plasmid-related protein n=1 Tax=Lentisalinibacter salinarum TaxID=2992239 RepID=UPI00386AB300